jgi:predicted HTH domain antitoxin
MVTTIPQKSTVITIRLSSRNLHRLEAVRTLEKADRSTLIKEFLENGVKQRVIHLYSEGKLSAGRGADILGISLREFLELLEHEYIPVNWNSQDIKDYMKAKYGE